VLAILCHRWQKANTNQNYLSNPEQKKTSDMVNLFPEFKIIYMFLNAFIMFLL